jgi:hypothetical protein
MDKNKIPGFAEAVAKEREWRDFVMLGLPYLICGVEIRILTLAEMLVFMSINHPLFTGGFVPRSAVFNLLWFLSPEYLAPGNAVFTGFAAWRYRRKAARARRHYVARLATLDQATLRDGVDEYLDMCYLDSPGGSNGSSRSTASWLATAEHHIASRYGWSRAEIRTTPLPEFFQLLRKISGEGEGRSVEDNKLSDSIVDKWLIEINSLPEEERLARIAEVEGVAA